MGVLQQSFKDSGVMPPALKNEPKLASHLLPYLDAYNSLRCHRTRSEAGYNPLAYADLVLFAQTHGYMSDAEGFKSFEVLIQACDHEFLAFADEQRTKAINAAKAKSKAS